MKKLLVFFSFLAITACVYAQDKNILKLPVPHYKILKADSTYATWTALKKDKPVMLIYFMPDCPHCQHLMSELRPKMDVFKNMQIVMICSEQTKYPYMKVLKNFNRDFDLSKYKNITMGTEYPNYTVMTYLHVQNTPFVALYDRNGKMVKYFDKQPKAEDIIAAAKKI
jgi:thioredoxin-related protein